MAAPGVLDRPDIDEGGTGHGSCVVVVYDNDKNSFEDVIEILVLATECSVEEAEMETWEVHHLGKSVVHQAARKECEEVAGVIRTIGIKVEVREE
ncbi:hypothetical protein BH11ARM2_BH11ARM2_23030 [soil metagenome]